MELTKEMVTVALGTYGIYKAFEPLIMRIWTKKEQQEDSQSLKIDEVNKRCECLERDIMLLKSEKVSWKELNKQLEKIDSDISTVKVFLAEIKGILKKREE